MRRSNTSRSVYLLELGAVCYLSHSRDVKHNRLKENILHSGGLWETICGLVRSMNEPTLKVAKAPRKREGPSRTSTGDQTCGLQL